MNWPKQDYASMVRFFGPVGENQTSLELPFPMVLTWDETKTITKFTCHERVAGALGRILKKTLDRYGIAEIQRLRLNRFSGCLNVRRMRGSKTAWSVHSWGAALDIDDINNQLRWGRDKATLDNPEYQPFWEAVEAEGLVSLGMAKNYDWMHLQAATL